jgi:hypothetical protein
MYAGDVSICAPAHAQVAAVFEFQCSQSPNPALRLPVEQVRKSTGELWYSRTAGTSTNEYPPASDTLRGETLMMDDGMSENYMIESGAGSLGCKHSNGGRDSPLSRGRLTTGIEATKGIVVTI